VSGVVELMGLPVCWLSSMDVRPALNWACDSSTHVRLMLFSLPRSLLRFFRDLHRVWCTLAVPLSDPSWNCFRPDTRL
jgi:hypothetical protein